MKIVQTSETIPTEPGPVPYCEGTPNNRLPIPFFNGWSVGPTPAMKPTGFSRLHAGEHRWVSELRFQEAHFPALPGLGEHYLKQGSTLNARPSHGALAYACPNQMMTVGSDIDSNLWRPQVKVFSLEDAVRHLLTREGCLCELSDKGRFQRDAVQKLGGLGAATRYLQGPAGKMLAKFLDHARRRRGIHDEGAAVQERTYLDLTAVAKIVGDEALAANLLDQLTTAAILSRGFLLHCEFCLNAGWYPLADLSDSFCCTRCVRHQIMTQRHWKSPTSPQIYYKLDEIAYQFLTHDGDVPVLALDWMRRNSSTPFHYCEELKLWRKDNSDPCCEVDLLAVWNGDLIIGEAKKAGSLGKSKEAKRAAAKLAEVAGLLMARKIVLATSAPDWDAQSKDAITSALQGRLATAQYLTGADLRA